MRIPYHFVCMSWMLSMLALLSCGRGVERSSVETAACRARIKSLTRAAIGNYRGYHDELNGIYCDISVASNEYARLDLFRSLAREMISLDFSKISLGEREMLSGKFTFPFYGLAKSMVRDGATEQETGDLVINAFMKFHELCFPPIVPECDENTHRSEMRQQRTLIRGLRSRWENDTSVWEHAYISNIFRSYSKEAEGRFLARWRERFGCRDKRLH